tara:strand:- start:7462 stop:7827 length:366 start_codon:yes stop_codon:yes gene_type:complete
METKDKYVLSVKKILEDNYPTPMGSDEIWEIIKNKKEFENGAKGTIDAIISAYSINGKYKRVIKTEKKIFKISETKPKKYILNQPPELPEYMEIIISNKVEEMMKKILTNSNIKLEIKETA